MVAEESQILVEAEELAQLINRVKAVSKELVLSINVPKIKVLIIDWAECLPESYVLKECEKVETFGDMSSTINTNGGSLADSGK